MQTETPPTFSLENIARKYGEDVAFKVEAEINSGEKDPLKALEKVLEREKQVWSPQRPEN